MAQTILITSGKGGVGKSTVCLLLGCALARQGRRVLLLETDSGLRSLDIMTGLGSRVVYDLSDVLSGRCDPAKAVLRSPLYPGVELLPAAANPSFRIPKNTFRRLLEGLKAHYDSVLIDCPAGFHDVFEIASKSADMGLIVTVPNLIAVKDGAKAAELLFDAGVLENRLIINALPKRWEPSEELPDLDAVIDMVGLQLAGVIPLDLALSEQLNRGQAASSSVVNEIFDRIAQRLQGEWVPLKVES